ncbi:MAG: DeoR/GlpR family DNA-binding transcription regulator [Sphaerochaetaceae bacterium]|nr:DeoR/GlpR family DNA-binding transcription regulator [Sphaerochaetaceae bacterium]
MKQDRKAVDERQHMILEMVKERGEVHTEELSEALGISLMTVRRYLRSLEERGVLQRVHGGAVSKEKSSTVRATEEVNNCRRRISEYAAGLVSENETIYINGSMTALNMLKYAEDKTIIVITNNGAAVAGNFGSSVSIKLTGGLLHNHILVGDMTMQTLLETHADKAFLGCAAVYDDGEFRYDVPTEIGINEIMVARTREHLYILADHTKLRPRTEKGNSYGSCRYSCAHTLITDELADPQVLESLRQEGINVITVPVK